MLVWTSVACYLHQSFFASTFLLLQLSPKFPYFVDLFTDHGQNFERHGHPDLVIGYGPNSWEFSLSCSSYWPKCLRDVQLFQGLIRDYEVPSVKVPLEFDLPILIKHSNQASRHEFPTLVLVCSYNC